MENLRIDSKKSGYKWEYGTSSKVKTYRLDEESTPFAVSAAKSKVAASGVGMGYQFKTAESFLNSLNKKANTGVDISSYKEGQRVYHKRFGEGTINKIEAEEDDYKLDISFDKVGNKRLMAKFAGLEII